MTVSSVAVGVIVTLFPSTAALVPEVTTAVTPFGKVISFFASYALSNKAFAEANCASATSSFETCKSNTITFFNSLYLATYSP